MNNKQDRRRLARKSVAFGVQIQQGDLLIDGVAQDYSVLGLGFRASVGYDDGFCSGDEALAGLTDDPVVVRVLNDRGDAIAEFPGAVRWLEGEVCGIENLAMAYEMAA